MNDCKEIFPGMAFSGIDKCRKLKYSCCSLLKMEHICVAISRISYGPFRVDASTSTNHVRFECPNKILSIP